MKKRFTLPAALLIFLFSSCDKKGEVTHYQVEKSPVTKASPAHVAAMPNGSGSMKTSPASPSAKSTYTWTLPKGWSDQPASGMRLGTIIIPSGDTTLSGGVFEFGGDLVGNINRWRGQVALPPLPASEVPATLTAFDSPLGKDGKGFVTLIINPASPEKAMLATIIPRPSGTSVFIKVMGSTDALKAVQSDFYEFAKSFK